MSRQATVVTKIQCETLFWFVTVYINPFLNKPWFLCVYTTSLQKTPWEKEILLETSIFIFSHNVFHSFGKLYAIFISFENDVYKLVQFGVV